MHNFKVFMITFLSSICIVLTGFAALYWMMTPSQQPVGTAQDQVPITRATAADSKTALVFIQSRTDSIFLLTGLNAAAGKVSVTAIPPDLYIPHRSRSLAQSFEYAGIMQCVQDLSEHLDAAIDYHLVLDSENLSLLDTPFADDKTEAAFSFSDSESLASFASYTIKNSLALLQTDTLPSIVQNFSWPYTNIGKTEAAQLDRILSLLQRSDAEYVHDVINN